MIALSFAQSLGIIDTSTGIARLLYNAQPLRKDKAITEAAIFSMFNSSS
jgi:hypothetical protein